MSCDDCPVGFHCPLLITASPQPCPSGFYANETKSISCTECDRGKMFIFFLVVSWFFLVITFVAGVYKLPAKGFSCECSSPSLAPPPPPSSSWSLMICKVFHKMQLQNILLWKLQINCMCVNWNSRSLGTCMLCFCIKCFVTLLTGHKCPDPTQPPEECPAGYFSSVKGETACTQVSNYHK